MTKKPRAAGDASGRKKRSASSAAVDLNANVQDLTTERKELWEASALSPAGSVSEGELSPGVRAALEQLFGAGKQPRLGRVAEQGAIYAAETTDGPGEGIETLASRYGVTLETLAARMNLTAEALRAPCSDCPPALLAEVARALPAPVAEIALALRPANDHNTQAPDETNTFIEVIKTAPSLIEEQRRHWLALLAADPRA
jgi:hypothetical protein